MADSVKINEQKKKLPKVSLDSTSKGFKDWAYKNRFYILAFFIPAIITYIAYAMFEVYPFGDNSVLVLDLNGQYIYYFEALRMHSGTEAFSITGQGIFPVNIWV